MISSKDSRISNLHICQLERELDFDGLRIRLQKSGILVLTKPLYQNSTSPLFLPASNKLTHKTPTMADLHCFLNSLSFLLQNFQGKASFASIFLVLVVVSMMIQLDIFHRKKENLKPNANLLSGGKLLVPFDINH